MWRNYAESIFLAITPQYLTPDLKSKSDVSPLTILVY